MRLAVIGGSFNPVHRGHLALARAVREREGYDLVLFIPASDPPHKDLSPGAGDGDRLAMLELARLDLASELALPEPPAWLRVDDSEIVRGGVSYTIDTIRSLAIRFRDSLEGRIGLVIGDDLVAGFSSWKAYRELGEESDILLARRPGISQAAFPYRHKLLEGSFIEASSTTVREAILRGDPSWISLVPPSVSRYITHHRLYERRN